MGMVRIGAADIGVQAFDPMDKTLLDQEIERPIDRERGDAFALDRHVVQDGVGAARPVPAPDQLKHLPPDGGQARAARGAELLGTAVRHRYSGRDHVRFASLGGIAR